MSRFPCLAIGLALLSTTVGAQVPPPSGGNDFKVLVEGFGLKKDPIYTEELVCLSGRVYQFVSNAHEIVVLEPARSRVELLDMDRRIQSEVTFDQIDESLVKVRGRLEDEARRRESTGKRADQVEAEMTRNLARPGLVARSDPGPGKVRLTNPSVEVDALGEPEPEAARLATLHQAMTRIAQLGAFRTPNDLPPFVELEAIQALAVDRKLRPKELSYLYRLAGPPRKFRRTYRLIPEITERDREAIRRIDRFRESTPIVRYERYRVAP